MKPLFNKTLVTLTLLTTIQAVTARAAQSNWTSGHGDIGIAYEDGWDLHIHAEGAIINGVELNDVEFDPADILIQVPESSQATRPAGAQWNPIGTTAGRNFWLIPQVDTVGVPFVGFGTEEIPRGDFAGDAITLKLTGVSSPSGTGQFSVYQTDLFGAPTFAMSTADGIDAADHLALTAGGHLHANFSFSEAGLWAVTFEASGTHAIDGFVAGEGTYYFNVVPEPATAALCLLGGIGLFKRRHRFQR